MSLVINQIKSQQDNVHCKENLLDFFYLLWLFSHNGHLDLVES